MNPTTPQMCVGGCRIEPMAPHVHAMVGRTYLTPDTLRALEVRSNGPDAAAEFTIDALLAHISGVEAATMAALSSFTMPGHEERSG